MKSLPSQFDDIRSSLNTKKEGCSMEELTANLVKEEDDIKLNRLGSVDMVSHQVDKLRKFF